MRQQPARERMLDAAATLFYERGVTATGLADVLVASGTGKGQLYHYFDDKADLVRAVAVLQADRTLDAQLAALADMRKEEDLRSWIHRAVEMHAQSPRPRCPLGAMVLDVPDAARSAVADGFRRWRDALSTALGQLQYYGVVRQDHPPDDLAETLLCTYKGGVLLSDAFGHVRPLRIALTAAVDAMVTSATR